MNKRPKALEDQIRRAEEMHQATYGRPDEGQADTEAAPEEPREDATPETEAQAEPQEQPQAQAEPDAQDASFSSRTEDPGWEQRYRSLQGKYNKEVPSLVHQLRQANARLEELESKMAEVSRQPPPASDAAPAGGNTLVDITEEEREEYGEEYTDFLRRKMETAIQAALSRQSAAYAGLEKQVTDLKAQNETLREEIIKQGRLKALESLVPDFKEVNKDKRFIAWLKQVDPVTGMDRMGPLQNAWKNGDVQRVAQIMKAWPEYGGDGSTPSGRGNGKVPMSELAGPPRTTSAAPPPSSRPTWTRQQIANFYDDVRKGLIPEKEKKTIEASIYEAMANNRVVN